MKQKIIAKIIWFITQIINLTLRVKVLNDNQYYPSPAVYPFWHGDELSMLLVNQKSGITIMASLSKDGEIMANLLKNFGFNTVRGSSARGGGRGLLEITRLAQEGKNLAFAADGPKGPYHQLKAGIIKAAQKSGLPVIPVVCSAKNRIIMSKSWDKGRVPLPFSKIVQLCGNPIFVKESDDIEAKRIEVETELNKIFELTDNIYWTKDIDKYLKLHPFARILIVKPSSFGDIVQAMPAVAALKKTYPNAKITWTVFSRWKDLIELFPFVDHVIEWDRKSGVKGLVRAVKETKKKHYDLVIDMQGLLRSALYTKFINARYKIAAPGMREFSNLLVKQVYKENKNINAVARNFEAIRFVSKDAELKLPEIQIPQIAKENAVKLLKENNVSNDFIVLFPFARGKGKDWSVEGYSKLCQMLKEKYPSTDIVILSAPKDFGKINSKDAIDLCGKTDTQTLAAVISQAKLAVGADTGPMHLASMLNIPAVFIFGNSSIAKTAPYFSNGSVVANKENQKDIKKIMPEEVFKEVAKWIK